MKNTHGPCRLQVFRNRRLSTCVSPQPSYHDSHPCVHRTVDCTSQVTEKFEYACASFRSACSLPRPAWMRTLPSLPSPAFHLRNKCHFCVVVCAFRAILRFEMRLQGDGTPSCAAACTVTAAHVRTGCVFMILIDVAARCAPASGETCLVLGSLTKMFMCLQATSMPRGEGGGPKPGYKNLATRTSALFI